MSASIAWISSALASLWRATGSPLQRLVLVWLMGNAAIAAAQSNMPNITPDELLAKGRAQGDYSHELFSQILGPFWDNPFAAVLSQSVGLVAGIFLIFNTAVFVIGVLWASWGVVSGVVETADSGEVLGRRQSTVWMPIRMGFGFAQLVPIFGGYSLAQVFMVLSASMGIGLANMMYGAALNAAAAGNVLPMAASTSSTSNASTEKGIELVDMMVQAHACRILVRQAQELRGTTQPAQPVEILPKKGDEIGGIAYPVDGSPTACGRVIVKQNTDALRQASDITSFRLNSVDYDGVGTTYGIAFLEAVKQASDDSERIARTWLAQRRSALASTSPNIQIPVYPKVEIDNLGRQFALTVAQQVAKLDAHAKAQMTQRSEDTVRQMRDKGWVAAGAWTQTYMEINAAHADAVKSVTREIGKVSWSEVKEAYPDAAQDLDAAMRAAQLQNASVQKPGDISSDAIDNCALGGQTATGNCSWGQHIVKGVIGWQANNSGGAGQINPLIAFKNIGDYFMVIGQTIVGGATAIESAKELTGGGGEASKGAGGFSVLGLAGKVFAKLGSAVAGLGPYMIVLGVLLAIYLPMIPFLTWMGGITQYAVVVFQGIAGASLAGLAHLDAEGDGLGQRTNAWYMLLLSVTFRPALMLIGYFLALILMLGLAKIQAELFLPALANAQGNSITGVLSIVGFITVFALLNWTLIQSLFNMVFIFPDQILGLVGTGNPNADLGRETENSVRSAFAVFRGKVEGVTAGAGRGAKPPPVAKPNPKPDQA